MTRPVTPDSNSRTKVPPSVKRATIAGGIGTFVEYYDFIVYAYFASVIGPLFFPEADEVVALLLTFGAFATSWVVRPLGALIFGPLGDKWGRRNVLAVVILLMSAATATMGLLPTYGAVGVLAPILLIVLRLVQGLAVGGEFGSATSYVAEFSPARRRGLYLSWLPVAGGLSILVGSIVAAVMTATVPAEALSSWGWRVPFLVALPLGIVGLVLRLRLQDTPAFTDAAKSGMTERSPLRASLRRDVPGMLLVIGTTAALTVAYYIFLVYTPSYLTTVLDYDRTAALLPNIASIVVFCIGMPFFGALSDRVGRKPVLIIGSVLLVVLTYPAFVLMRQVDLVGLVAVFTALGLLTSIVFAPAMPILSELFATATRNTSLSLGWNVTSTLFGGSAPLIATALVAGTGNVSSPAFFVIFAALLSGVTAFLVRETARTSLQRTEIVESAADTPALRTQREASEPS